jgi:hypothetical protein
MKIGFICLNVPGHLNPMTALARHLQARNHDVVSLYSSGAAGLPFVPGPEKDHVNESVFEVSRMQGDDVLEFIRAPSAGSDGNGQPANDLSQVYQLFCATPKTDRISSKYLTIRLP